METAADGSFEPSRPATGAEAEAAIDRLGSVAGIAGVAPKDRP
jgi:hypothetical protein